MLSVAQIADDAGRTVVYRRQGMDAKQQIADGLYPEAAWVLKILQTDNFTDLSCANPLRAVEDVIREIMPLDRYERRALSRRKSAVREFDLMRRQLERMQPT